MIDWLIDWKVDPGTCCTSGNHVHRIYVNQCFLDLFQNSDWWPNTRPNPIFNVECHVFLFNLLSHNLLMLAYHLSIWVNKWKILWKYKFDWMHQNPSLCHNTQKCVFYWMHTLHFKNKWYGKHFFPSLLKVNDPNYFFFFAVLVAYNDFL